MCRVFELSWYQKYFRFVMAIHMASIFVKPSLRLATQIQYKA